MGINWNRYYLRSFQIMLQATRGIVSGNPPFFRRAYGEDKRAFERLLSYPHAFIFHRDHFERGDGRATLDEYEGLRRRLSDSQERELIHLLAGPAKATGLRREYYRRLAADRSVDPLIEGLLNSIRLDTKGAPGTETYRLLPLFPELNPDPSCPKRMRSLRMQACSTTNTCLRPSRKQLCLNEKASGALTCADTADRSKAAS